MMKATSEQIVSAYMATGSVWKTAKQLGMCGQSVHERLVALGHPIAAAKWTDDEIDELRALAPMLTVGEIARRLGRPYAGVACKISRLKFGIRFGNRGPRKVPRGAGYSRVEVLQHIKALKGFDGLATAYCRQHGLEINAFVTSIQRVDPDFWRSYVRAHSDLGERPCPYCETPFIPANKRQVMCSRRCSTLAKTDMEYFGGKRRQTVGLAAGVCQLCMQERERLHSHHVLGKENDPENDFLVALCAGCHHLLGLLAARRFVDTETGWENLIVLVMSRRLADKKKSDLQEYVAVHAAVDLEWMTKGDLDDDPVEAAS